MTAKPKRRRFVRAEEIAETIRLCHEFAGGPGPDDCKADHLAHRLIEAGFGIKPLTPWLDKP